MKRHESPFVPGELLVRFRSSSTALKAALRLQLHLETGARQISIQLERLGGGPEIVEGLRLVRVDPNDTTAAIAALASRPDVLYAEPNFMRYREAIPNDPRYGEQWALKNTGLAGADLKAEQAWDITSGSRNVVVGIVDEGIDINHPDLRDNIWTNPAEVPGNGIDDDGNGFVDDINGWDFAHDDNTVFDYALTSYPAPGGYSLDVDDHGTHVAGTIGASGNNGVGITGVNWQVTLLPLKFLTRNGGNTANLLRTLAYAKTLRDLWTSSGGTKGANISVLNNSYGGDRASQAERDAIHALGASGILFVAAAGNEATDSDRIPHYPANYEEPNVIAVASTNQQDRFGPNFTNFGNLSVDVGAPGFSILSTTPRDTYSFSTGTSIASAHVSGVAALVRAANPGISLERLRSVVIFGGDVTPDLPGKSVSGRRVSALGALQGAAEIDTVAPAAVSSLAVGSQSGRNVSLQFAAPGDDGSTGRSAIYEIRYSDTDINSNEQFNQARPLAVPVLPALANTPQSITIAIPYQHLGGFLAVRAVDNVGNAGPFSKLFVSVDIASADPYLVTESASSPLSTGGTLYQIGDDAYRVAGVPFPFRFYGQDYTSVAMSSNGALYFPSSFSTPSGVKTDAVSSVYTLNGMNMIAGLWDDLRTDRRPGDGVYVVQPDQNHIIFRWQAVTFYGELPVNFEIELQRDGTIQIRYGQGNTGLFPVVGISSGAADAYVITSHTSETVATNLTNATTVTLKLRNPPAADLSLSMEATPNPVAVGQQLSYTISARNNGPDHTTQFKIEDQLPAGTTFVSCTPGIQSGVCSGPPVGTNGLVTLNLTSLGAFPISQHIVTATIVVMVNAPAGSILQNSITASSYFLDRNLSNNSVTVSTEVAQDTGLTGVSSVSAGFRYGLARMTDGTVMAWGANDQGQLGDGSQTIRPRPVQVLNLTNVTNVSAGYRHSMALKADGTVWIWGANDWGQLGIGNQSVTFINAPVRVSSLDGVVAISAFGDSCLALKSDGLVWAWGSNQDVRLGSTQAPFRTYSPVRVTALSNIIAISEGGAHGLALANDGTVWAWGSNTSGQTGPGPSIGEPGPKIVTGISGVTAIAAGSHHSVAFKSDGSVWVWGYGYNGEFGDGTAGGRSTPGPANISDVVAITAGYGMTLALKNDGSVWGWGYNSGGILGDGTTSNRLTPGQVLGLSNVVGIDSGDIFNAAVLADGSLWTWGLNDKGQLGDGSTITRTSPGKVSGLIAVAQPSFSLASGTYTTPQNVVVTCTTIGAVIHYTTNGQEPLETDAVISSGQSVQVSQSTTLKARAYKTGWTRSNVTTATYNFLNQIDDTTFFVRQHYRDFLNREADAEGLAFWVNNIENCGADPGCREVKRIDTSAAYFLSIEFQETGYLVHRFYRASFGQRPLFSDFLTDTQTIGDGVIVNSPGWQQRLEGNKQAFADAWVSKPPFTAVYGLLSNAQFVDTLITNTGVPFTTSDRNALVDGLNNSSLTRGQVVRAIAENQAFYDSEYNVAFVEMQYFGYLRRDPDPSGFNFWLTKLNNHAGDFRAAEMVKSFLVSVEYRQRFVP